MFFFFFFFNDTATTEIYTLSLHDALPISTAILQEPIGVCGLITPWNWPLYQITAKVAAALADRESTRLNSSHLVISYAGFCLEKKKQNIQTHGRSLRYSLFTATNIDSAQS